MNGKPLTASERYDLALYARLDALYSDPIFVAAMEIARLKVIADAAIAFSGVEV